MIPADLYNPSQQIPVSDWLIHVENQASMFLEQIAQATEETVTTLRTELLDFYFIMGGVAVKTFNAPKTAQQLWKAGINQAKLFFDNGETDAKIRESVLKLCFNAGVNSHHVFHSPTKAQQFYQIGINYAETFLDDGEIQLGVREQTLRLYFNAGFNAQQAFNNPTRALQFYQQGIHHAEQFLRLGETATEIRELTLKLYHNAGRIHLQAPFNEIESALIYWQPGLTHAEFFLQQGETQASIYELISKLGENILAAWGNQGQTQRVIQTLPQVGLWLWINLDKITQPHRLTLLRNWHKHLEHVPVPSTFTTAFQQLLHTFLLTWHNPQQPHRHKVSTETLLALSESLYSLLQAKEKHNFDVVYQSLHKLHHSSLIQKALALSQQQHLLEQRLTTHWHQLGIQPATLDELTALHSLSWWQKHISQRKTIAQLREDIAAYHRLRQMNQLSGQPDWQGTIEQMETSLLKWLYTAFYKQLNLSNQNLEELADIILGIILVSQSIQEDPVQVLETWHQIPPWQDAQSLQTTLANSGWEKLADAQEPFLFLWLDFLGNHPIAQRLNVGEEQIDSEQPGLQTWLRELAMGKSEQLAAQLQHAWENAQQQATTLAPTLAQFLEPESIPTAYQQALIAQILGDVPQQLEKILMKWLSSPHSYASSENKHPLANKDNDNHGSEIDTQEIGTPERNDTLLHSINTLKQQFDRAISIYPPSHLSLAKSVHHWANVWLAELLASQSSELTYPIWEVLERARISSTSVSLTLANDWEEQIGQALWTALATPISWLEEGKIPNQGTPWPLFKTWLDNTWVAKPPTVEICQQHLLPQEALVQPFFDPIQRRLRILWLDKQTLILRDLPDAAAHQRFWIDPAARKGGLLEQWGQVLSEWQMQYQASEPQIKMSLSSHWDTVITSRQMKVIANCLVRWAKQQDISQITVIFPTELAQLPWEVLPELEAGLVRANSVTHWLKFRSTPTYSQSNLSTQQQDFFHCVMTEPTRSVPCKVKEAQWVAQHFNANLITPSLSAFDAIQNIVSSHRIHFALPIHFNSPEPLLAPTDHVELPGWIYTLLPISAQLVVLLPSEVHWNNPRSSVTEIIPTLVAAGAKTVVGTLWPCPSLAALCFSYYFYQIADNNPLLPWHQVTVQARHALRDMSTNDLQILVEKFQLSQDEACYHLVKEYLQVEHPFNHPVFWVGLTVFGDISR